MKKERCPDYCPFLKKEAFHCRLFDKPLIFDLFLLKCEECMNADVRKTQYKKKVKDFEKRQIMWDRALKHQPNKLWQQMKISFADWKDRKEIKAFLTALIADFPILLDKKTNKLLLNLYLVLDSTEKGIMKEILSNSKTAEIFLNAVKQMGAHPDLLKHVRRQMDNIILKKQKELENEEVLRRQRLLQNTLHR